MPQKATESDVVRFWRKVRRVDGCWTWTGALLRSGGYGAFRTCEEGKQGTVRAHRFSWEITNGPIPKGMHVCHRCDNPPCVRPDHLFLGTDHDNMMDMSRKGRRTWKGMKGEDHPSAKLNERQVKEIREQFVPFVVTRKMLAARFGVSKPTIEAILSGRLWPHV